MNVIQKSEAIKVGLRKGFQDGSSKMARRKCYGYEVGPDSDLTVNPDEAQIVRWIFERYLAGDSLGKIAAGLERQGILSPTGKSRWNREAIDKLLSNEKYTRPLAKLSKAVKVADTGNQGKAESKALSAVTVTLREDTESFKKTDGVFNKDTFS